MKKVFSLVLSLIFILSLFSRCDFVFADAGSNIYSYLLIGLDDAGGNTDVLAITSYNASDNHISVIQIPRDTYYGFDFYQNKINQFYPKMIAEGKSKEEAFSALTNEISSILGIRLRGYISASTSSFVKFIDSLGGAKIIIDDDFQYIDEFNSIGIPLSHGENRLDGESALKFVRYRSAYSGGDLTRLDVQKIFFAGMFDTVYTFVVEEGVCKLFKNAKEYIDSNFSIVDIILMVIKHSSKFKTVEFVYFTLPGKAYKAKSGLWYYQLNMPSLKDAIKKYLYADFSPGGAELILSEEIYYDKSIDYKVFKSQIIT